MRTERGWSQRDLATAAGVRQPQVSGMELATANPTLSTLESIAKALDTDVSELLSSL